MRLDHIAWRVKNRWTTAKFFMDAFGYKLQQEFTLDFGEGKTASCIALEPPEKINGPVPWAMYDISGNTFVLPFEIFISDGNPGSIVGDWVETHGNAIHHMAFQVDDVEATMKEWREKGYAEFSSEHAITCPGLTQVFSKPSSLTGVIYEFIKRDNFGFCKENVLALMSSSSK